jgi:glyoxylase-like metal-dependent hydrolase (beta-lactamase superfamily II)
LKNIQTAAGMAAATTMEVNPLGFTEVNTSLYTVMAPFHGGGNVFLYLLKGDRIALVDTGVEHTPGEVLRPALAEMGLALADIYLILNTHAHLDHAGGNGEMKKLSKASIHLHRDDSFMADSVQAQVEFMTAPLIALDFPEEAVKERAEYTICNTGRAVGADVLLSEGDTVDLGKGIVLRVVHNPGHTPGSISYFWESEGILLVGDGAPGMGSRPGGYPLYFNAPDYRRSLAKLSRMDFRMMCLGHAYLGGTLVNNPIKRGADCGLFLKGAIQTADTIHRAAVDAVRRMPGAGKRELALAMVSELVYSIPQVLLQKTGMPGAAAAAFASHIDAALNGGYPV